jgi:hypothetical protein
MLYDVKLMMMYDVQYVTVTVTMTMTMTRYDNISVSDSFPALLRSLANFFLL